MFPTTTQNGYRKNPSRVDLTDAVVHYSGDAIRGERGHNDTGSAARFFAVCPLDTEDYPPLFYCTKASKRDRNAGLDDMLTRQTVGVAEQITPMMMCAGSMEA